MINKKITLNNMETTKAVLLILILVLFIVIGCNAIALYLAGETLKAIFWLMVLILLTNNRDK